MIRHGPVRQALWLVRNGVPWDIAINLDESRSFAWSVIFREFEGEKFNTHTMEFEKPK